MCKDSIVVGIHTAKRTCTYGHSAYVHADAYTHMPTYKSSAKKLVITKPNAATRVNTREETVSVKRRVGVCVGVGVIESTESVFPQVQDLENRIYKSTMCLG